jgi:hypothetical protein
MASSIAASINARGDNDDCRVANLFGRFGHPRAALIV